MAIRIHLNFIFFSLLLNLIFRRIYTIVASENIRPYSNYRVSVSIHNQTEPVAIRLRIEDEEEVISTKDVDIVQNETKLVVLPVQEISVNGYIKFIAEGISGISFMNSTLLNVESKNYSLFISTDKAIYKPGEIIKFRVLVLDFDLKPVELDDERLKVFLMVNDVYELRTLCAKYFSYILINDI